MNSKTLTVGLAILALFFTSLIARSGVLAWMALPFLFYLVIGVLQAPASEKVHFEATRSLSAAGSEGDPTWEMRVTVRNLGAAVDHLLLSDRLDPGMEIIEGSIQRPVAIGAGEETELKYTFRAGRGMFTWKSLRIVASDPLGLIETELKLPAEAEATVHPEMEKFPSITLRSRSTLHSPGSIPARREGSGTDFWGVREYQPGDSLRWLDWRLAARHPHKFFTREFEQEEIADISLVLDARQKTDLWVGDDSLFEHAVSAAGSLAKAFLHQGHRVSLLVAGDHLVNVYPGYGKLQLNRILRCLSRAKTGSNASINSLQHIPFRIFSRRSLIVILSPLARGDGPLFPRIRSLGYQALLISPDPFDFARPVFKRDAASSLAVRSAYLERCLELRKITQLGIPVIDWQVDRPLSPLVRGALSHSRAPRQ